jgi:hypothetical protein
MRLLIALVLACPLLGQSSKVSIELGSLTVYLGESKADFQKRVDEHGYKTLESETPPDPANDDTLEVGEKICFEKNHSPGLCHFYGSVQFLNGKVVYASREWDSDNPKNDVLNALISVTQDTRSCVVTSEPMSSPKKEVKRVFIRCGQRQLGIIEGKMTIVSDRWDKVSEVVESIGEAR